jgi:hypothetical protein
MKGKITSDLIQKLTHLKEMLADTDSVCTCPNCTSDRVQVALKHNKDWADLNKVTSCIREGKYKFVTDVIETLAEDVIARYFENEDGLFFIADPSLDADESYLGIYKRIE